MSIGVFTFVVLRVVGVPNALAFAVLAAFADVIPLIGAFIAIIPPVAAALQESSTQALIVLVALFLYQQFEDRYLVPRVYGRTLNLPPVIVLIAVLAGAELLGVTGVLLALPITAAGRVALDYVLENRARLWSSIEEQPFAPDVDLDGEDPASEEPTDGVLLQSKPEAP
jgi:predicted PurR-regulated permease PerM